MLLLKSVHTIIDPRVPSDTTIAGGDVVAGATEGNAFSILMSDGRILWVTETGFTYVRNVPIPVANIAFYLGDDEGFVAKNGDVWKWDGGNTQWLNLGQAPGNPVPTSESTWGKIKSDFDKED